MIRPGVWLRETRQVYFDNAASVRDYRVQLRGNRSVMLFGIYLIVLIGAAMLIYSDIADERQISVVDAQRRLRDFYGIVVALLGGIVSLVAPALTATAIVLERQRRSLDLVFSAPVTPRYYLVGKMLASFRYTWMLLVLALPVTAACVVLGGASWSDVLVTYLALSMHGLVFTAMALLMSTVVPKPVAAVVWSYACAIAYLIFTAALTGSAVAGTFMSRSTEAPFFASMNPFLLAMTINTHTTVGGYEVPNWAFTILLSVLACKLFLLSAGVMLSARPAREIASLRIHCLAYMVALMYYMGYSAASSTNEAAMIAFWCLFPLFLVMPFIACFGVDAERRYRPNGWFNWRQTFVGTPAGALPYVLLFVISCLGALAIGKARGSSFPLETTFAAYAGFIVTFWTFSWAVGRFVSSLFVGLRAARVLQFGVFIFLVAIPVPFLSTMSEVGISSYSGGVWDYYILRAFVADLPYAPFLAGIWTVILAIGTLGFALSAERNIKRRLPPERLEHERHLAST